jgi:hypothetical protein
MSLLLLSGPAATLASAEEATPTGTFIPAGELNQPRLDHHAMVQPDGSVVILGGFAADRQGTTIAHPLTEIWDPDTATFTLVDPPVEAPEVVLAPLPDGRFVGKWLDSPSEAWETWDPLTGERTVIGDSLGRRYSPGPVTVALSDGRILIIGGWGRRSAEILDLATGTFSWTGGLPEPRYDFTATLLSDGRVLVVGGMGEDDRAKRDAHVWDPTTGRFEPTGKMAARRSRHTATLLPDGRVLVVGGSGYGSARVLMPAEIWDPVAGSFSPAGTMVGPRWDHTATLLADGRVLVIGYEAWAEAWDPTTETFARAGLLERTHHSATLLPDGRVLVVGGIGDEDEDAPAAVWDPEATPPVTDHPRPKPKAVRQELREYVSPELRCRAYPESEVGNDPFAFGAVGAIICESRNHPNVEYVAVFRFPDARSLDEYWTERLTQNPPMERRKRACKDGKKGYGKYPDGTPYVCYVTKSSGRALIRWIEPERGTYGVIDANDRDLAELWDAWLELGPQWYGHQL